MHILLGRFPSRIPCAVIGEADRDPHRMNRDLELTIGTRYVRSSAASTVLNGLLTIPPQSLMVLIFFAPYIAFQLPGAIIVKKLGPRWTLPTMTMAWGVLVIVGCLRDSGADTCSDHEFRVSDLRSTGRLLSVYASFLVSLKVACSRVSST